MKTSLFFSVALAWITFIASDATATVEQAVLLAQADNAGTPNAQSQAPPEAQDAAASAAQTEPTENVEPAAMPSETQTQPPADQLIAHVVAKQGLAQYRNTPDEPWQEIEMGQELSVGAEIRTGLKTNVVLRMGENATVNVGRLTTMTIAELAREQDVLRTRLGATYGRLDIEVDDVGLKNDMEVATPVAVLSVKGTGLSVRTAGNQFDSRTDHGNVGMRGPKVDNFDQGAGQSTDTAHGTNPVNTRNNQQQKQVAGFGQNQAFESQDAPGVNNARRTFNASQQNQQNRDNVERRRQQKSTNTPSIPTFQQVLPVMCQIPDLESYDPLDVGTQSTFQYLESQRPDIPWRQVFPNGFPDPVRDAVGDFCDFDSDENGNWGHEKSYYVDE